MSCHDQVNGLTPKLYRDIGKLVAKSLMDSRLVDLPFNPLFFRWILGEGKFLNYKDLEQLDGDLSRSLNSLRRTVNDYHSIQNDVALKPVTREEIIRNLSEEVDALYLDFTIPGSTVIELMEGGAKKQVTLQNLETYLQLSSNWVLVAGVSSAMESFREGFECVFSISSLSLFYPQELAPLLCGEPHIDDGWTVEKLIDAWDSSSCPESSFNLAKLLSYYDQKERKEFLRFTTGSSFLPVGGFKSLSPKFKVVKRIVQPNERPDDYYPCAATCVFLLTLPLYSTPEKMREKMKLAIKGPLNFMMV